jgi:1-acylglycerone phosphate reductase
MHIIQVFSPLLVASQGTIVQIGSITAFTPYVYGAVYNASKAALHAYSNTLRIELEPFGVKVITVVTGGVQSRIARGWGDLPKGSLYWPAVDGYRRRVTHSQEGAMATDVYAKRVVARVLGLNSWTSWLLMRSKRFIWAGNRVWFIWFWHKFLWESLMDAIMTKMFGLARLRREKVA